MLQAASASNRVEVEGNYPPQAGNRTAKKPSLQAVRRGGRVCRMASRNGEIHFRHTNFSTDHVTIGPNSQRVGMLEVQPAS